MIDLQLLYLGHYNKNTFCQIISETETEESKWSVQSGRGAETESVQSTIVGGKLEKNKMCFRSKEA